MSWPGAVWGRCGLPELGGKLIGKVFDLRELLDQLKMQLVSASRNKLGLSYRLVRAQINHQ